MLGGDWPEGWQYGPLSVLEYALATRAIEEAGVPQPEMDAWVNKLGVSSMTTIRAATYWPAVMMKRSRLINCKQAVLLKPTLIIQ